MDTSQESTFLEKVHINNFLSLHDVEFALKPLTVLVGANASGKSNVAQREFRGLTRKSGQGPPNRAKCVEKG